MPGTGRVACQIVCPRSEATLAGSVMDAVVVSHGPTAHRAARDFLEEVREPLALPAPLPFVAQVRHVLNAIEQRRVDDFGVVPRNDFLPYAALLSLEFGNIIADNSAIAQQLVDVAFVPHRFARVPSRNALFHESPGDDAPTIPAHVHVEDATDKLRTFFEHVNFAVTHLKPARDMACHDDAVFRLLALRFPVRPRSEGLVLALAIRAHHVCQDRKERGVRGQVKDHVLGGEANLDPQLRDVEQELQGRVHAVAREPVQRFDHQHRTRRNLSILGSLEKAAKRTGRCIVAAKSGNADVLQRFRQAQAVGFDESHGGFVLSPFAIAPSLAL